jgi:hypothetical protein
MVLRLYHKTTAIIKNESVVYIMYSDINNEYVYTILKNNDYNLNIVINRDTNTISLVSSGVLLEIQCDHIHKIIDYNFK